MFNIGFIEFLLIFFITVLFIKPEDIPKLSKNAGLFYRKLTRYFYNLKYELSEFEKIEKKINLKKKTLKKSTNEISKPSKRIKK